jgi:hypothetical protein
LMRICSLVEELYLPNPGLLIVIPSKQLPDELDMKAIEMAAWSRSHSFIHARSN